MRPAVLLTLGRLPKGLELARALAAAGCRVVVAEPFALHLSRPSRAVARSIKTRAPADDLDGYLQDLLDIVAREMIDLVVPVSEEALHVSRLAGRLPAGVRLASPPFETLARLHDKLDFNRAAAAARLAVPETHAAGTPGAADLAARAATVVKPRRGCSGEGVRFFDAGKTDETAGPGDLVQARIDGRHVSSFSIASDGRIVATVLYEATILARVDDAPAAAEWCARFVAAENYSGFIAFDFIIDGTGVPQAIECNPRLTSGVHFLEHQGLAAAVLSTRPPHAIGVKPQRKFQEGHTALLEVYGSILKPREALRRLGHVLTSRDVLFSVRDPLPFPLMTPMSAGVLRRVAFEGMSFGAAATRDIAWTGERARLSPDGISPNELASGS